MVLVVVLAWCCRVSRPCGRGVSRPCGRGESRPYGRLDSRRVALPHLCTLGWVLRDTRVEWSAIYPVLASSTCCRCPRDALEELADDQSDNTTPLGSLPWWASSGLRATAAGRSRMRVCGDWLGPWAQMRGAPQAPLLIITSVDGRIAGSEHFIIIEVDARSVAGLAVSAAWDE